MVTRRSLYLPNYLVLVNNLYKLFSGIIFLKTVGGHLFLPVLVAIYRLGSLLRGCLSRPSLQQPFLLPKRAHRHPRPVPPGPVRHWSGQFCWDHPGKAKRAFAAWVLSRSVNSSLGMTWARCQRTSCWVCPITSFSRKALCG